MGAVLSVRTLRDLGRHGALKFQLELFLIIVRESQCGVAFGPAKLPSSITLTLISP